MAAAAPATLLIASQPQFAAAQLAKIPAGGPALFMLYGLNHAGQVAQFKAQFPTVKVIYVGVDLDYYTLENIKAAAGQGIRFANIIADISSADTQQAFNCAAACLLIILTRYIALKGGNVILSMMPAANINTAKGRFLYDQLARGQTTVGEEVLAEIARVYTLTMFKPDDPYHAAVPAQAGGSQGFRIWNFSRKYNKIYTKYADLDTGLKYDETTYDYPPRCHWGQKKLLLSEIQFLTRIRDEYPAGQVPKFCIVYIGSADGTHMPILYDLFPEFDRWLLYDPARFNRNVYVKGISQVFNMFFTDDTIAHVRQHAEGRPIIFISDIRVTPNEELIMTDMINQAKWGIELAAEFMLLKYRIPYDPNVVYKLALPTGLGPSPGEPQKGEIVYLDGDVYIQLYPPIHSTEMRLFVRRGADGKYALRKYNCTEVEERLFNYNTVIRGTWNYSYESALADIPINKIIAIPGYDAGIESILEYNIIRDYARRNLRAGSDLNIRAVELMFDINEELMKSTGRSLVTCNQDMYVKRKDKMDQKKDIAAIWARVDNVNKNMALLAQKARLESGVALDPPRTRTALAFIRRLQPRAGFAVL